MGQLGGGRYAAALSHHSSERAGEQVPPAGRDSKTHGRQRARRGCTDGSVAQRRSVASGGGARRRWEGRVGEGANGICEMDHLGDVLVTRFEAELLERHWPGKKSVVTGRVGKGQTDKNGQKERADHTVC
jgi:hypothetical protein